MQRVGLDGDAWFAVPEGGQQEKKRKKKQGTNYVTSKFTQICTLDDQNMPLESCLPKVWQPVHTVRLPLILGFRPVTLNRNKWVYSMDGCFLKAKCIKCYIFVILIIMVGLFTAARVYMHLRLWIVVKLPDFKGWLRRHLKLVHYSWSINRHLRRQWD